MIHGILKNILKELTFIYQVKLKKEDLVLLNFLKMILDITL